MNMAKAYNDYIISRKSGWSKEQSIDHACHCWDVAKVDLLSYIETFGDI